MATTSTEFRGRGNSCAANRFEESCDIIYGTIRLTKKDEESFLAWAKEDYARINFNLRVFHTLDGIEKAKRDFRACRATLRRLLLPDLSPLGAKGSDASVLSAIPRIFTNETKTRSERNDTKRLV